MPVPEKIVIDGKEYSVKDNPEILELVQEVRKEEKDKLYSKISTTEAKIKVLEDEKKSTGDLSAKKDEELQKLKDDLAVTKKEKSDLEAEIKKVLSSNPPLYRPYMEEVRQQLQKRTVLLN